MVGLNEVRMRISGDVKFGRVVLLILRFRCYHTKTVAANEEQPVIASEAIHLIDVVILEAIVGLPGVPVWRFLIDFSNFLFSTA